MDVVRFDFVKCHGSGNDFPLIDARGLDLPAAEKALGWPARAGRLVLTLALDRLADHYRLP